MKQIILNIGIALLVLCVHAMNAQQGMVMYQLENVQQANYQNPAFNAGYKMNIGIPALSGVHLRMTNTFFQPQKLFTTEGGQVTFEKAAFLNSLKNKNFFGVESAIELLSFGYHHGDFSYSFSVRDRINSRLTLPKDFLSLPFTGNANFDLLDQGVLDFSGLKLDLIHFREFNLGLQKNVTKYLSVGGRVKLLYGYENVDFAKSDILWETNETTWDWDISGQLEVNTSGIIPDSTDTEPTSVGSYLFKKKNRGVGLDLGAVYAMSNRLTLSASLLDLGYIEWKNNISNTRTDNSEFIYDGIHLTENMVLAGSSLSDSIDVQVEQLKEDFKNSFNLVTDDNPYTTSLMANLNLGAKFRVIDNSNYPGNIGLHLRTEFYKGDRYTSIGLSYQQKISNHLNAASTYSIQNGDFKNLGLGFAVNFGIFQFYSAIDNIFALNITPVQFGESSGAIPIPTFSKNAHLQFGFNLAIPYRSKHGKILSSTADGIGVYEGNGNSNSNARLSKKRKIKQKKNKGKLSERKRKAIIKKMKNGRK